MGYHARMAAAPAPRIVLASRSPRRRRLLSWLGVPFESTHVDTPEDLDSPLAANPPSLAAHLAAEKAIEAAAHHNDALILCFDTVVVHDGAVLGKPLDTADAWRMLRSLSGRTHEVVTGVAAQCPGAPAPATFAVTTRVRMKDLDDAGIEAWMARGEYLGCAGAYNIEGQVASVTDDECYQNVAGMPLCHLYAALRDAGRTPCAPEGLASPVAACDAALQRRCRLGPRVVPG